MDIIEIVKVASNESKSMILKPVYRGVFSERGLMGLDLMGITGAAEYFCRFFEKRVEQKTAGIEVKENEVIFWNNTERYSFGLAPSMLESIKRMLEGRETDSSFCEGTGTLVFGSTYQIRTLRDVTT